MPYDLGLAVRLEDVLGGRPGFEQKKMFGGIGWMLNGNMCVGVYKEWLIARVGESAGTELFKEEYAKPMNITGKPMKGWAMIAPEGVARSGTVSPRYGK
jgi:hypothetical protein